MGDCGNQRCLQEKRYFRKELLSWYKKVPYAIGLESVAEHLAGPTNTGNFKTLLLPFNDMENGQVRDFDSQPTCYFCEGKVEEEERDWSTNPHSVPEIKQKPDVLVPHCKAEMEGFSSFYNQLAMTSFLYTQQQLQTLAAGASSTSPLALLGNPAECPVDLSACQHKDGNAVDQELRVPEIKLNNRKKKDGGRRGYTDDELNAAVEAIQSGTIGTRRAAQMFGVPRSTLRNKVFKAAEMNKQGADSLRTSNGAACEGLGELRDCSITPPQSRTKLESPSPSSSEDKDLSPTKSRSSDVVDNSMTLQSAFTKHLEDMRGKHNFNPMGDMRPFGDMFNPMYLGYPFFMPQYHPALASIPGFEYMNPYTNAFMMPYLPDIVKTLTQRRLEAEKHISERSSKRVSYQFLKGNSNEEIKVPAFKSTNDEASSFETFDHGVNVGHALKNIISKNAASKTSPICSTDYMRAMLPPTSQREHKLSVESSYSPSKRPKLEQTGDTPSENSTPHSNSSLTQLNISSTGKKRPKRGQYRKYDSELLSQAVQAVQRGEMSVHRAGTFFGVPHSTLEYKVKERHLLRKKKMAEIGELSESKTLPTQGSALSSASSDSSPNEHVKSCLASKEEENSNISSASSKSVSVSIISTQSPPISNASAQSLRIANTSAHSAPISNVSAHSVPLTSTQPNFIDYAQFPYSNLTDMNSPATDLLKKLQLRAHRKASRLLNGKCSGGSPESTSCAV